MNRTVYVYFVLQNKQHPGSAKKSVYLLYIYIYTTTTKKCLAKPANHYRTWESYDASRKSPAMYDAKQNQPNLKLIQIKMLFNEKFKKLSISLSKFIRLSHGVKRGVFTLHVYHLFWSLTPSFAVYLMFWLCIRPSSHHGKKMFLLSLIFLIRNSGKCKLGFTAFQIY